MAASASSRCHLSRDATESARTGRGVFRIVCRTALRTVGTYGATKNRSTQESMVRAARGVRRSTRAAGDLRAACAPNNSGNNSASMPTTWLAASPSIRAASRHTAAPIEWPTRTAPSGESVLNIYRRIEDWHGAPDPAYRGTGGPVFVQPAPKPNPVAPAMVEGARSVGIATFENQN